MDWSEQWGDELTRRNSTVSTTRALDADGDDSRRSRSAAACAGTKTRRAAGAEAGARSLD